MTVAELKDHYARPAYDPFVAYADYQAHPEKYVRCSIALLLAEISIRKAKTMEDLKKIVQPLLKASQGDREVFQAIKDAASKRKAELKGIATV